LTPERQAAISYDLPQDGVKQSPGKERTHLLLGALEDVFLHGVAGQQSASAVKEEGISVLIAVGGVQVACGAVPQHIHWLQYCHHAQVANL
jgi:hypothetical protein